MELSCIFTSVITTKTNTMTTQEINIANALLTAKEVVSQMRAEGLGSDRDVFALSNVLCAKYDLNFDQSLMIIEQAAKA